VENNNLRAALRVYPAQPQDRDLTLFDLAARLGAEHGADTDAGIETLLVFLGANNALSAVDEPARGLERPRLRRPRRKGAYTVWRPEHFAAEFAQVVEQVRAVEARHVIWCTIPHVTIAPIARGIGRKQDVGSAYFPYYARPWVGTPTSTRRRTCTSRAQRPEPSTSRSISTTRRSRTRCARAARRAATGTCSTPPACSTAWPPGGTSPTRMPAPPWWTPYPLPAALSTLAPPPDSLFLTGNAHGGRATGGLFSLDGVHPTTVGYGILAQEIMTVMRRAGVAFFGPNGGQRDDPVTVDFARLLRLDTLVQHPPQNITSTLDVLGWADEAFGWSKRALTW
jgi:hypothetical protein